MRRSTKALVIVGSALVVIVLIGGIGAAVYTSKFRNATKNITVNDIDVSGLRDGKYYGSFNIYHVSADVEVAVKNGEITDIYLVEASTNEDKLKAIIQQVLDKQSLEDVDTVSGATVSQKAVLKAIEDALKGEPN